ncbi:MAG: DUF2249 domain-containing protein [Gammaproteobacteria bacterium]|nr:DUF2249 domain-containing protein [Gammaproteobacteria bacterium]
MSDRRTQHVVDARFMAPPEPFEAATAMLHTLQPGDTMLLRLYREPHPLYKALLRQGHSYRTELLPDGTFDILITRGTATQPPA